MPWIRTPGATRDLAIVEPRVSAFPIEREGRLLRARSISRLILPFTFVPACTLSVYASQWVSPPAHARLDTWLLARLYHGGHLSPLNSLRFKAHPLQNLTCNSHVIRHPWPGPCLLQKQY